VPLFVEEMTKMVLEAGLLREGEAGYELTGPLPVLAIPTTLHDALMARLDRLTPGKAVAQLAATIGRQCPYDLLRAVAPWDEATLQRGLRQLVDSELLYQRGVSAQATYHFKHALIQDADYQSLLKRTRQQYHQHIAQVLESQFPKTTETRPELLAHHYTEAGQTEQALPYWQRAGHYAIQRSAYQEARVHASRGLELFKTLPETSRHPQQELALLTVLGTTIRTLGGHASADVETLYNRAWELCQQVEELSQVLPVLWGLLGFYTVGGQYGRAYEVGQRLLTLGEKQNDPTCLLEACRALGSAALYQGNVVEASPHFENGIALFESHFQGNDLVAPGGSTDCGVFCYLFSAESLWPLGYIDQARARVSQGLQRARGVSHPFTLQWALMWAAHDAYYRREVQTVLERAEEALTISTEYKFGQYIPEQTILRAWALTAQDRSLGHISQIHQQLAAYAALGGQATSSYLLLLLADALSMGGQTEEALAILTASLAHMKTINQWKFEAETHRLKGEVFLSLSPNNQEEVEACFQQALDIARRQQAKSWELRAAASLARLWQQ
jgi:tetratricopeptide (TPR) repeat protein